MTKILIIGNDAYLAQNINFSNYNFSIDSIERPYNNSLKEKYYEYDFIVNFCIQPEHQTRILDENEMIDVSIAKNLVESNTKLVFLSSRKVYGYNTVLKTYKEEYSLNPFDFYSKNKKLIEQKIREILPKNHIILRTGNIIDIPIERKNYKTFVGWIFSEIQEYGKVKCTVEKHTRKDFITRNYFQKALLTLIENNVNGTYNVGSGFAFTIEEILLKLLPQKMLDFDNANNKSDQFILNVEKLHKYVEPFTKEELTDKCEEVKNWISQGVYQ